MTYFGGVNELKQASERQEMNERGLERPDLPLPPKFTD